MGQHNFVLYKVITLIIDQYKAMLLLFLCTQFCRIKGYGGAGWPPPIIFERLKLPSTNYISSKR